MERVFGLLRADVEALFMTAPSVSLNALHADLTAAGAALHEQVRRLWAAHSENAEACKIGLSDEFHLSPSCCTLCLGIPGPRLLHAVHDDPRQVVVTCGHA